MRRDELGELGRDFDAMAARLEKLAQAQRHLLGDISHELRSPLTRLVLALALARRQTEESEALDRIEREAGRLDTLIDQLLTLASLEAGLDPGRAQQINIHQLVQGVADDADFEAGSQDRRVLYHNHVLGDRTVQGSAELLRSAVENVVRNALRYTPPGRSVEMTLSDSPETVCITVRDYGPGVPSEALEEIFRPFRRVDEARDRGSGGVGLGLSITERSMALHGGTVTAENHPDGGLCVALFLPVSGSVLT
jgi:two-component system sensor histidine kinase CpxA